MVKQREKSATNSDKPNLKSLRKSTREIFRQKFSPIKNFTKNYVIPHEAADKEAEELNQMRVIV